MSGDRDNASENPYAPPMGIERPQRIPKRHSVGAAIGNHVPLMAGIYLLLMTLGFLIATAWVVATSKHSLTAIGMATVAFVCGPLLIVMSAVMMKRGRDASKSPQRVQWHGPGHPVKRLCLFAGVPFLLFAALLVLVLVIEMVTGF